jgi:transglutaminase-like putative cysteine protease
MLLHVRHETVYHYAEPARFTIQSPGQRTEQVDAYGNIVHYLTVESPHRELRLVVTGAVETDDNEWQSNGGSESLSPLAYRTATVLTHADAQLHAFARATFPEGCDARERLLRGAAAVAAKVAYRPGSTLVSDTAVSAFQRGEGVCQDQAHVFIACCRVLGLSARYVSGYLLAGSDDAVASHAWAEVWLPDTGQWHGVDITHHRPAGSHHVRLAVGRDYLDAAPVRGMRRGGGQEQMSVAVLVTDSPQQ